MKLYEMEGFLRGKCVPGDMLVNETDAQYLVRKFTELNDRIEVTTLALREKTKQCEQLAAENAALKSWAENRAKSDDSLEQELYSTLKIDYRQRMLSNIQTPATDAYAASLRAEGIKQWIASREGRWNGTTKEAEKFAAQLRSKSEVQS